MHSRLLAAAVAVLALAAPARAQDAPAPGVPADTASSPPGLLRKGAWSLTFTAPGYSGSEGMEFGLWEMVGPRTNAGVTLEVFVNGRDRDTDTGGDYTEAATTAGLGFNLRRYVGMSHRVAPYLQGRVFGRGEYNRAESGDTEASTRGTHAGVEAGLGAEWFPVRQFSLSGHTGARFMVSRYSQTITQPTGEETEATSNEALFRTFTSSLSVRIYF